MNFQTMNKQRKFILIAAAAGIISVFLPWATISVGLMGDSMSQSANGFRSYGIPAFLGFAAAAAVALIGDQTKILDKTMWIVSIIAGAISFLFTVLYMLNISSAFGGDGGLGVVDVGYGFGIWIALVASIGIVASAWMFKNPADDLKGAFDSLKKDISVAASSASNTISSASDKNDSTSSPNKIAELERLSKLRENGSITEEEYQQLKSKIL
jgi:hypothetical protein